MRNIHHIIIAMGFKIFSICLKVNPSNKGERWDDLFVAFCEEIPCDLNKVLDYEPTTENSKNMLPAITDLQSEWKKRTM